MSRLWMGISQTPEYTRVLLLDGPGKPLMKARLPAPPAHPRAVQALCEALALWCGQPIRAALAAEDAERFCDTTPWLASWDGVFRNALCEIRIVSTARPPRAPERISGLGNFNDVRQLVLFEVAE